MDSGWGGSSTTSAADSSGKSLNGLKFGRKLYFEDVGTVALPTSATGSLSSGALQPKKARASGVQARQPPRCQVEGCKIDLSDAKAYYSRHRVCCMHSKYPKVIVAGLEQRFCQQCSRFHQLSEFDQGKRSCRRRLAGHNERRRKPPPGSLSARTGRLFSSFFDNGIRAAGGSLDFSAFAKLSRRDAWPTVGPSELIPESESHSHSHATMGKFLLRPWQNSSENSSPDLSRTGLLGPQIPSGGCVTGVVDSTCALSLLSNQPWGSANQTSSSLGPNDVISAEGAAASAVPQVMAPAAAAASSHFTGAWSFRSNEADRGGTYEVAPDLGLSQISHPGGGPFSGNAPLPRHGRRQFLESGHSRAFGTSIQPTPWSL